MAERNFTLETNGNGVKGVSSETSRCQVRKWKRFLRLGKWRLPAKWQEGKPVRMTMTRLSIFSLLLTQPIFRTNVKLFRAIRAISQENVEIFQVGMLAFRVCRKRSINYM